MLAKGEVGGGGKCSVPFAMSDRYSNVAELPASSNKKKFRRICRGGTRTKLHRYAIRQLVKFQLANCSFFWFHWLNSHYQHTTSYPLEYPTIQPEFLLHFSLFFFLQQATAAARCFETFAERLKCKA
jgi:hypothetical protein